MSFIFKALLIIGSVMGILSFSTADKTIEAVELPGQPKLYSSADHKIFRGDDGCNYALYSKHPYGVAMVHSGSCPNHDYRSNIKMPLKTIK